MREKFIKLMFLYFAMTLSVLLVQAQKPVISPVEYEIQPMLDLRVPMSDGVELSTDVYLPKTEGPFPVIFFRTPYDNAHERYLKFIRYFVPRGYAFVIQDVRGRGDSDGMWNPFFNEAKDGRDSLSWIMKQKWCNGKIGMMGGSYCGFVQWAAASEGREYLICLSSTAAVGYESMDEYPYVGGVLMPYAMWWLNYTGGRTLQRSELYNWEKIYRHRPVAEIEQMVGRLNTVWRHWIEHDCYDDYWKGYSYEQAFPKLDIPVLHITGWFDDDQHGEMLNYRKMIEAGQKNQKLVIGPWTHGGTREPAEKVGEFEFGKNAVIDVLELQLRWFDYWLKGMNTGIMEEPPVRIYLMGQNRWVDEFEYPLARTVYTPWYLRSKGRANSLFGDGILSPEKPGKEPSDHYDHNPENPAPAAASEGADLRPIQRRDDVLVYTSPPLEEDIIIVGPIEAVLYAASSTPSTDFVIRISDVFPDGRVAQLQSRILCSDFRNSPKFERREQLTPGKIEKYVIKTDATGHVFLKGHRIRLDVGSALAGWFVVNPNTGEKPYMAKSSTIAHQSLYHDAKSPSHIILPIIPEKKL